MSFPKSVRSILQSIQLFLVNQKTVLFTMGFTNHTPQSGGYESHYIWLWNSPPSHAQWSQPLPTNTRHGIVQSPITSERESGKLDLAKRERREGGRGEESCKLDLARGSREGKERGDGESCKLDLAKGAGKRKLAEPQHG